MADRCGPDVIIFPSLKGQPVYDFLERRLDLNPDQSTVLVPGIPNRFLAIVPAKFDVAEAERAFQEEWQRIAKECRLWLTKDSGGALSFAPPYDALFGRQVDRHWQITWQLWPWQDVEKALAAFKRLPLGAENPIHLAKTIAEGIPEAHKDKRCYRSPGNQLEAGWAWSAHYQLCQHALDARRSLRDFDGLPTDPTRKPGHRDALSGREEAVVEADVIETLKSPVLRALFRHAEPLGAANLVKRVWHKAYLDRLDQVPGKQHLPALNRARESFDSVPSVATGGWLHRLQQRLANDHELWFGLIELSEKLAAAATHLHGIAIQCPIGRTSRSTEDRWLEHTEAGVFTERFWNNLEPDTRSLLAVSEAVTAIRRFKQEFNLGEPPVNSAVPTLTGDYHLGKPRLAQQALGQPFEA